jgi:hypothetical protein
VQDNVKAWLPHAAPLSVADALRLCANASNTGPEDWSEAVPPLAEQACAAVGRANAKAPPGRHAAGPLASCAPGATGRPLVPQLVEQQRQRFMERWKEAMALTDGATLPEAARTAH